MKMASLYKITHNVFQKFTFLVVNLFCSMKIIYIIQSFDICIYNIPKVLLLCRSHLTTKIIITGVVHIRSNIRHTRIRIFHKIYKNSVICDRLQSSSTYMSKQTENECIACPSCVHETAYTLMVCSRP